MELFSSEGQGAIIVRIVLARKSCSFPLLRLTTQEVLRNNHAPESQHLNPRGATSSHKLTWLAVPSPKHKQWKLRAACYVDTRWIMIPIIAHRLDSIGGVNEIRGSMSKYPYPGFWTQAMDWSKKYSITLALTALTALGSRFDVILTRSQGFVPHSASFSRTTSQIVAPLLPSSGSFPLSFT